jgi:transposase
MAVDGKKDVQFDVSSAGRVSRLEVLEGPTGRKQRSEAERARIAVESFRPGVSVSEVARRYGATRSQVYDWRRRLKDGRLALPGGLSAAPSFAEVMVTPEGERLATNSLPTRCRMNWVRFLTRFDSLWGAQSTHPNESPYCAWCEPLLRSSRG